MYKCKFHKTFSTFPYIPRKASFREKRFSKKSLGHNFKVSDLHFTWPLIFEKIGKRSNSITNYDFKVKSALNTAIQENFVFIFRSAHFPAFRKKLHFEKNASLKIILDTIHNFSFPFRCPILLRLNGALHFWAKIVNASAR